MLKKIMMAGLAVGALALNAPAATAGHVTADCGFNSLAQETATGGQDTYVGGAYGVAVASDGSAVTLHCEVRVDGSAAASTPPQTGTGATASAGPVSFTATDTQSVELCAVWSSNGENGESCGASTNTQIPPQEVIDLLDAVFQAIADGTAPLDPIICDGLKAAGVPGALGAALMDADDCDLYDGSGNRLIDFVPYED